MNRYVELYKSFMGIHDNKTHKKRVLVACEESQVVTIEFRNLGFDAYSCDVLPCGGNHPEWHIQGNVLDIINNNWDLMVAFPPCTFLSNSGVQWLSHPDDKDVPFNLRRSHPKYPNRRNDMIESMEFVKKLYNAPIPHIAIENPVGILSSMWKHPSQIIQPYMFGDEATKTTCLWLKNLPPLVATDIVDKGSRTYFKSGKSHPKWYADIMNNTKNKEERQTLRSKTFGGVAKAIASQWGNYISS